MSVNKSLWLSLLCAIVISIPTFGQGKLTSLEISSGMLSQSFEPNISSYTAVDVTSSVIQVTPTAESASASITVSLNGEFLDRVSSGFPSLSLILRPGFNTVALEVTDLGGGLPVRRTYTIQVTKPEVAIGAPIIYSFAPATATIGSLITISGDNLSNTTAVTIGGVAAIPISSTGTRCVAMVMPGTNTGTISLTTSLGNTTSAGSFSVSATPTLVNRPTNLLQQNQPSDFEQGSSVAVSADGFTAVVAGNGANSNAISLWVYTRTEQGNWQLQGSRLAGLGSAGLSGNERTSVAISADGNTIVAGGAADNAGVGAVWIFTRNSSGVWTQQGNKLVGTGSVGTARQGSSVGISADGNTVVVGARNDNNGIGATWVFTRSGTVWAQQGNKLIGSGATGNANQGATVAVSANGNTLMLGGPLDNSNRGAVWVFTRSGSTWTQQGLKLVGTGFVASPRQGTSVALSADGNTAIVGGPFDATDVGAAWIFTRSGSTWSQLGNKLVAPVLSLLNFFGTSVGINAAGTRLLINSVATQGSVTTFFSSFYDRSGSTITLEGELPIANLIALATLPSSLTAANMSASGNDALVGWPFFSGSVGAGWAVSGLRNNVALKYLAINASAGELSPTFLPSVTTYSATVAGATTSIGIDALPESIDAGVDISINGASYVPFGNTARTINLNFGANIILLRVEAPNNSTRVYTVTITRTNPLQPTIQSITPSSGPVGTVVTVNGSNLAGLTALTIAGTTAIPISNNGTTLTALVMPGATSGVVSLTTPNGSATSSGFFATTANVPPAAPQGNKLFGAGFGASANQQGWSVSLNANGDVAVVGGPQAGGGAGAVWVYSRSGSTWTQQAVFTATNAIGNPAFGISVDISADGNTLIMGGWRDNSDQGAAWISSRGIGSSFWSSPIKLIGTGGVGASMQGFSVAISADGQTAIVGGRSDNGSIGAAWIFVRNGSSWTQQGAKLVGSGNTGASFQGYSVDLSADGNTAVLGGWGDNAGQGAVWIFTRTGTTWSQQGSKLVGTGAVGNANQGLSVAISADGNTLITGAPFDNSRQGAAWVFTRTGTTWTQQGSKLVGTGNVGAAELGYAVSASADGNTSIVGGIADNSSVGAAWVFTRSGNTWTQQGVKRVGAGNLGASQQGRGVGLSANGNVALSGGPGDNSSLGAAWAFSGAISNNANLIALALNQGTLSPTFAPAVTAYQASVANAITTVQVTATTANAFATVRARMNNGNYLTLTSGSASPNFGLNVGANTLEVEATAQDGVTIRTYTVTINRPSNNADLSALTISTGTLTPAFADFRTDYTVSVANSTTSMTVTPTVAQANATIQVRINNGAFVPTASGVATSPLSLNVGANPIQLLVTAQDGTTKTYTIVVTRVSNNANLSNLVPSVGMLSPVFIASTLTYTMSVANAVSAIAFTATSADANATMTMSVNGAGFVNILNSGVASDPIALPLESNTVAIRVRAQDGTTLRTYTITINRISVNADLSGLTISAGSLSPTFSAGTTAYSTTVGSAVSSVTVSPTAASTTATIRVRVNSGSFAIVASGANSASLPLNLGNNTIDVQVTAQDGTTIKLYTITVTRLSSVASLNNLVLSAAAISPTFSTAVTQYTATVANNVSSTTVTPTATDPQSSIQVRVNNGSFSTVASGATSPVLALAANINTIEVRVTSQDGNSVQSYFIEVTRQNISAELSNLTVTPGALSPAFQSNLTAYNVSVTNDITAISVTPTSVIIGSTIQLRINGGGFLPIASGATSAPLSLNPGSNMIDVRVTAQDAVTTRTYTITVNRTLLSAADAFTPTTGPVGTLVTISGANLQQASQVSIGGVSAILVSTSPANVVAMVMPGTTGGTVSVTTPSGVLNVPGSYTVSSSVPPAAQQGNKLVGTNASSGAEQGRSVRISADGNTAVVGGYLDNGGLGAVWVYTRSNGVWSQQGTKLTPTGNAGNCYHGWRVSISADGNTVIAGAILDNGNVGAAFVHTRTNGVWSQQAKLVGTGNVGASQQGSSVALSADGNTAVVGGFADNTNQGAVWIFTRTGSSWSQQGAKLVGTGNVGAAQQGWSSAISADGNTVIVGGQTDNGDNGAAWIFTRAADVWTQQGNKLVGTGNVGAARQAFDVGLSADGNTAVLSGWQDNGSTGASWIFTRTAGVWSQQGAKLVATGGAGNAAVGVSVTISADGNTVMAGGASDNGNQGAIWAFTRTGSSWTQEGNKRVGTGGIGTSRLGVSISLSADGNTVIAGGNFDDNFRGAAWVFNGCFTAPPSGATTQLFCASSAPTVASLVATGSSVQWFSSLSSNTPLAGSTALANSEVYFATQSINGCVSTSRLAVAVTLTPAISFNLTSGVGSNNRTICINSVMPAITYSTVGATGATVTGLPTGLSGVWLNKVLTISGTPTQAGVFNYTATITGPCAPTNATGTISVAAAATVTAGPALTAVCPAELTPALGGSFGGSATGAIWSDGGAGGTFFNNSGSNPGLTTYQPAPTATGTLVLTLSSTGSACSATTSKSLVVNKQSVWLGLTNQWNAPSNWSTGAVPAACTNVLVQTGVPVMPLVTGVGNTCFRLTINPGARVEVLSGAELLITGQ